jgi:hypothetical protein
LFGEVGGFVCDLSGEFLEQDSANAEPCILSILASQDWRQPTGSFYEGFGLLREIRFLEGREPVGNWQPGSVFDRGQNLILLDALEIIRSGWRPPISHLQAQGFTEGVSPSQVSFVGLLVRQLHGIDCLSDNEREQIEDYVLWLLDQPIP